VNAIEELALSLSRLPGVGKKSATRIAYWMLKADQAYSGALATQILSLRDRVKVCRVCGTYAETDPCPLCLDSTRDRSLICVVEQPQDVSSIEASREYRGLFHVLGGVIAPLDGVGPEKLRIAGLVERLDSGEVKEVILAMNPTVEGDTTALYIQRLLKDREVAISRLASGLPVGGDLEYADRLTLARSLRGRVRL
jgi:recombination protein RecR